MFSVKSDVFEHRSYFNFSEFNSIYKQQFGRELPTNFLEWFIGLYEGDGTVYSTTKAISVQITSIHRPTLEYIKDMFGFGTIYERNGKFIYWVEQRHLVYLLLTLFNGNLVFNRRIVQLMLVINEFNTRLFGGLPYKHTIDFIATGVIPSLNDAWFSGFVDAEGHFGLPIETGRKSTSSYLSIAFECGQNGERWLFELLSSLFNGGALTLKFSIHYLTTELFLKVFLEENTQLHFYLTILILMV